MVGVPAMVSIDDSMDVTASLLVKVAGVGSVPDRYSTVVWTVSVDCT